MGKKKSAKQQTPSVPSTAEEGSPNFGAGPEVPALNDGIYVAGPAYVDQTDSSGPSPVAIEPVAIEPVAANGPVPAAPNAPGLCEADVVALVQRMVDERHASVVEQVRQPIESHIRSQISEGPLSLPSCHSASQGGGEGGEGGKRKARARGGHSAARPAPERRVPIAVQCKPDPRLM